MVHLLVTLLTFTVAPNGLLFAKSSIRRAVLAKMLSEILDTRVMVKRSMSRDSTDKSFVKLQNNRQLALKYIANVTYGYVSASFSGRMPCAEIADSIVQTGREILEKVRWHPSGVDLRLSKLYTQVLSGERKLCTVTRTVYLYISPERQGMKLLRSVMILPKQLPL